MGLIPVGLIPMPSNRLSCWGESLLCRENARADEEVGNKKLDGVEEWCGEVYEPHAAPRLFLADKMPNMQRAKTYK